MKKKVYAAPTIKVKVVDTDDLMEASGNTTTITVSDKEATSGWAQSKQSSIWDDNDK